MSKRLMPREVIKIEIHKNTLSTISGTNEFTSENKVTDFGESGDCGVLDMSNKIIIKYLFLDEALKEGTVYDLLICQKMADYEDINNPVDVERVREKVSMKLTKIEIPAPYSCDLEKVTYVFEKVKDNFTNVQIKETKELFEANIEKIIEKVLNANTRSVSRYTK